MPYMITIWSHLKLLASPGNRSRGTRPVAHVILSGSHSRPPAYVSFCSWAWANWPIATEREANFCLMRMLDKRSPFLKWTRPETPRKSTPWICWRNILRRHMTSVFWEYKTNCNSLFAFTLWISPHQLKCLNFSQNITKGRVVLEPVLFV